MTWNLKKDSSGWLDLSSFNGVYVSSSKGNDSNTGTQAEPFKTLTRAMRAATSGVSLQRGDVWNEILTLTKSGKKDTPFIITSHGEQPERPRIKRFIAERKCFFVVTDLEVTTKGVDGFWLYAPAYFWLENCKATRCQNGITIQNHEGISPEGTVSRCIIADNYPSDSKKHSQGIYVAEVRPFQFIENYCFNNGHPDKTVYNHNMYGQALTEDVIVRGNCFFNGSLTGAQCRGGGLIEKNWFEGNPNGLNVLWVMGGGPQAKGPRSMTVRRNVFCGYGTAPPVQAGAALSIGSNVRFGVVEENAFLDNAVDCPIVFEVGRGADEVSQVGFNNIVVTKNVAVNCGGKGIRFVPGKPYRNVQISKNKGLPVQGAIPQGVVVNESAVAGGFSDPARRLSHFMQAHGFQETKVQDWIRHCMSQSRWSWDTRFMAEAAVDHILAGFDIGSGSVTLPPLPPPPQKDFELEAILEPGNKQLVAGETYVWPEGSNVQVKVTKGGMPKRIDFWLDGIKLGGQSKPPYYVWGDNGPGKPLLGPALKAGPHTLEARADADPTPLKISFLVLGQSRTVSDLISEILERNTDPTTEDLLEQLRDIINADPETT